ncbi:hypothetical protein M231_03833 [Tremella mesenterica]|uniref:Zn(2)-C6 fungal-type domain-containing protein n=1 Tax=Tremella mesenterica TaxID=5217 RepID=A0A4Q1BM43_TREME|nr:hypothetical protein M231_03833 [Tremella mesenterica]
MESRTPLEGPEGTETAKRRKKNVSRACIVCRRRRTKCDGQPRCATCKSFDEECIYDPDQDGRKPATKLYVQALVNRVRTLEEQLALATESPSPTQQAQRSVGRSRRIDPRQSRINLAGTLIVEKDSFTHHGPTSAFMHLPDSLVRDRRDSEGPSGSWNPSLWPQSPGGSAIDWVSLPWDRHLPKGIIQTPFVHEELLSIFFSYLNDWCWWTDESAFLSGLYASITNSSPKNMHYSPLLHNVILALACQLSPQTVSPSTDPTIACNVAEALGERARGYIEEEADTPQLSTVKGMMLLGSYHWSRGKHSLGWFYEGMGVRIAQRLGLNADCSALVARGLITAEAKTHRDRAFFTVYCQDQLWSLAVGRTAGLTTEDFVTPLPEIDADIDAQPWIDHYARLERRKGIHIQGPPSWTSTVFNYTCRLALLSDRMHSILYRIRPSLDPVTQQNLVSELHLDLHAWLMELPSPLRLESSPNPPPHIINLHATCRYLQILLHRPTYTQPFSEGDPDRDLAIQTCNLAAAEILRLLQMYSRSPGLRYCSTTICNVTFTAGTIFLLAAVKTTEGCKANSQALSDAASCIMYLREMSWPAAHLGGDILAHMKEDWCPSAPLPALSQPSRRETPSISDKSSLGLLGNIEDLKDKNSEIARFLTSMGWQPPQEDVQISGIVSGDDGRGNGFQSVERDMQVSMADMGQRSPIPGLELSGMMGLMPGNLGQLWSSQEEAWLPAFPGEDWFQ